MKDTTDYDGAWKEALDNHLKPFLEFCFPAVAQRIHWNLTPKPQDKELQEVVRDARQTEPHAPDTDAVTHGELNDGDSGEYVAGTA